MDIYKWLGAAIILALLWWFVFNAPIYLAYVLTGAFSLGAVIGFVKDLVNND